MIWNAKQAAQVQARRAAQGKRGVAKAVRRYMVRNADFGLRNSLDVRW